MTDSLSNSEKRLTNILNNQIGQVQSIISEAKLRKTAANPNQKVGTAADKSLKAATLLLVALQVELKSVRESSPPDIESDRRMLGILTVSKVPV